MSGKYPIIKMEELGELKLKTANKKREVTTVSKNLSKITK